VTATVLVRRSLLVVAVAAVCFGGWKLAHPPAPKDPFAEADARLAKRVDEYVALRLAGDWVKLYEMTPPEERERVNITNFLLCYGGGVIKVNELQQIGREIDEVKRTAKVELSLEGEIVPSMLPPPYNTLNEPHPEHLHQRASVLLDWVWRGNDWYFAMDPALVSGKSAGGQLINLLPRVPTPGEFDGAAAGPGN
jgi:hypothetical protein